MKGLVHSNSLVYQNPKYKLNIQIYVYIQTIYQRYLEEDTYYIV